ncbi:hypothetical protein LCGC14_2538730, partial [marine sediment metagenome]
MDDEEYNLMRRVQHEHWWWLGRKRIIAALLAERFAGRSDLAVADVGCGFGVHLPLLLSYGEVSAVETHPAALEFLKLQWEGRVRIIDARIPDKLDRRFDLILMADVLEHIDDDARAVDWLCEHLNDGGSVLLTVPAHRFFWTGMDEKVGHCRRYSKAELARIVARRFDIDRISYYNMALFPVKAAMVIFDRLRTMLRPQAPKRSYNELPPRPVNCLFRAILEA